MASILLVTADTSNAAYTRTKAAFEGAGHTVTGTTTTTTSGLDTAWGSGFDLIATTRDNDNTTCYQWISGKWAAGVPLLLGGIQAGIASGDMPEVAALGVATEATLFRSSAAGSFTIDNSTHPVVAGVESPAVVYGSTSYAACIQNSATFAGTELGHGAFINVTFSYPYLTAIEVGDTLTGGTYQPGTSAPARAVWAGFLYGGSVAYEADALQIFSQAIDWLVPAPPSGPTVSTGLDVDLSFQATSTTTPQTTVATGAQVGLDFAASPTVNTTTATGASIGLSFTATSRQNAAVSTPATIGLTFEATSYAPTTTSTGVGVGLAFTASPVVSTTVQNGVTVGLTFEAVNPAAGTSLKTALTVGLGFTATGGDARPPAWTADTHGRDLLWMEQADPATLLIQPPLAVPPATVTERPLQRISYPNMPAGTSNTDTYRVVEDYGVPHLFVGGHDVTYLRDGRTQLGTMTDELPGGEQTLSFDVPQIAVGDDPGTDSDLTMFTRDANVDVEVVKTDGTRVHHWAGRMVLDDPNQDQTSRTSTFQAVGALIADAEHQRHRAPIIQPLEDIGHVIPRVLNGLVSRRFAKIPAVTTGINTADRGTWGDTVMDHVHNLLAPAWTADQRQWTIAPKAGKPRVYALTLGQDPDATEWTYTIGQPGLQVDLPEDETQRVNVVYGHGVESTGAAWANWFFPDISTDDAPDYPYSDASKTINVGTTDADTDTGTGVSVWQQGAKNLGFDVAVDGTYDSNDFAIVERLQAQCGIQVDGSIGPQTWVATFQTGSNAGDLNNAIRLPLAYDPKVEPHLYAANGAVVGANPVYDRSVARLEVDLDFGTGILKKDGITSAKQTVAREKDAGRTGTLTANTDPWEGHRFDIRDGHKITLKGVRGGDLTAWVVSRSIDLSTGTATFKIDTKARDALTLASIQSRNIAAGETPSGRPLPINRRSHNTTDVVTQFDVESRAGIIPRLPLFTRLWTVVNVPVTLTGTISIVDFTVDTPETEFYIAVFGSRITAAQLLKWVGDPSTDDGDQNWTTNNDTLLDRFAWCEKWGQPDQPCGYYPGTKSDGDPLTGRLLDNNPLSFTSRHGGRAWVAMFATQACWIHGRIRSGPIPV